MKKIGIIVKEVSEKRIKESVKNSDSMLVIGYSGISSPDITSLRKSLKGINSDFFVVKNSVARRALKDAGLENVVAKVEGPCGLIFIKDEPIDASKVLFTFFKEHESLQIEGGIFKEKVLERTDIEALSKLPNKDVMRAQLVMTLKAPLNKLVMVLNGNLKNLVNCLEQIKKKKSN